MFKLLSNKNSKISSFFQNIHPYLRDGGGLDGGGGQSGVEVLLESEGWDHAHVADVEASVDQEQVPGYDEASQRSRDQVGIGQCEIHAT